MEEEQTNGLLGKKQLAECDNYINTVTRFLNGDYKPEGEMRDVMEDEARTVRLDIELHKVCRSLFLGEDYTDDVRSRLADFVAVLIIRYATGLAPAFVYGERKEKES